MNFNSLAEILKKYNESIIEETSLLKIKIFLLKKLKDQNRDSITPSNGEKKVIINYIKNLLFYLDLINEKSELTHLGFYLCYSTHFKEDFFKILTIKDFEFRSFCIDLIENRHSLSKINFDFLSNFFFEVPKNLIPFFVSINLFNIDDGINYDLLLSWKRNYTSNKSKRVLEILSNLNDIVGNLLINKEILNNLSRETDAKSNLLKRKEISLIISYEEFSFFNENLKNFFNIIKNNESNERREESINRLFENYLKSNFLTKSTKKDHTHSAWTRKESQKEFLFSIYNECQVCEGNAEKIEGITTENGDKYLEVHHIIPISKQNKEEEWKNYYNIDAQIKKIFKKSLDHQANLICLCPHHHKMLHHEYPKWIFHRKPFENPYFDNGKKKIYINAMKNHYGL